MEKYIQYYNGDLPHPIFEVWQIKAEAMWSLTQNWGHKAVYDFELLSKRLTLAGFTDVTRCEFQEGSDEALLLDHKSRKWETLYVEARKP